MILSLIRTLLETKTLFLLTRLKEWFNLKTEKKVFTDLTMLFTLHNIIIAVS